MEGSRRMSLLEGTKIRALREATNLLQSFGFNGFSFQHIADSLGIKKPSLYDHFKSKEELGQKMIEEYHSNFVRWTETVSVFSPQEQIGAYFEIFAKFSSESGKFCPLSAMIADLHTLPKAMKKPLTKMFHLQKDWLSSVIEAGQKRAAFRTDLSSHDLAELILSIGLGSQLIARISGSPEKIRTVKAQALNALEKRR